MRFIIAFALFLCTSTLSGQVSVWISPIFNNRSWQYLEFEVKDEYVLDKPVNNGRDYGGVLLECWYKERFGFKTGVYRHDNFSGIIFEHPIGGAGGGATGTVYGVVFPFHLAYRQKVGTLFKRHFYLQFAAGPAYVYNRSYDYADYQSGSYATNTINGVKHVIETSRFTNGQYLKHIAMLQGAISIEYEIFKCLTIEAEIGYNKGFKQIGHQDSYYRVNQGQPRYSRTITRGTHIYTGYRLNFRLYPIGKEKAPEKIDSK